MVVNIGQASYFTITRHAKVFPSYINGEWILVRSKVIAIGEEKAINKSRWLIEQKGTGY